jgi:hypothetical protein
MAGTQSRSGGLFTGLVLISVGVILLLHYYAHLDLRTFFGNWWPLLIIFWGVIKLAERTVGRRFGGGALTGGELLLVFAMLALMGAVVAWETGHDYLEGVDVGGNNFSYDLDVAPKTVPQNAHILIRTGRGDITVRGTDDAQIRVTAKKNVKTWSETEADRVAKNARVEITQNGDGYEIQPAGYDLKDRRVSIDVEVAIPNKSALTVRTDKGDVSVADQLADVTVTAQNGDVEVRNTAGDVSIELHKGSAKASDIKGDVKVSGKGGEIEVNSATGSATVDGDFYGPVRADKIAKGVRIVSARTDLTVSSLSGHMEVGSGNLDLIDAPGNVALRTRDNEVNVENPGGKVDIANRNAQTSVRFTVAPKEDVQITNSSSEISLTLPGSSSFEIVADCRNCDIDSEFRNLQTTKTESGDSHLAGKNGSGKGPKITLKTSYGNIDLRKSAIPIPAPPRAPAPAAPAPPPPANPPPTEQ